MTALFRNNVVLLASLLFLLINSISIYFEFYFLSLLPLFLILLYYTVFKLDHLFLLVVFCTPLSLNLEALKLGGIGLYLPTEPILLGLLFIYLFKIIHAKKNRINTYWLHPISFIITLQLTWILITSINSEFPIVSFKFFLSRLWFVIPVFFLGIHFFKKGLI